MTLWLVKWKMTQQYWSLSGPERVKVLERFTKMTEADRKSGLVKEVYYTPRGLFGYNIYEGSEAQVFEDLLKYNPYLTAESIEALLPSELMTEIGQRRMVVMKKET